MRICIDKTIPGSAELFATLGEVRPFDGRALCRADVRDADALIVRSITRVDEPLLAGSNVRFVGSATTGIDHIDAAFLQRAGITLASAPGCNARPVAEYVLTAILLMADRKGFDPREKTLGVVGVGRIGSIVAHWAASLGMHVLLYDPPRQRAKGAPSLPGVGDGSPRCPTVPPAGPVNQSRQTTTTNPPITGSFQWVSRDELLARSDLITLHVPLTRNGPDRTWQMVDPRWISSMRRDAFLINTSRGGVVSEQDLIAALHHRQIGGAVLDVWIGEPAINAVLARRVDIATPHIAGGTYEARRRAAAMIFSAMTEWMGCTENAKQVNERTKTARSGRSSAPVIPPNTSGAPSPLGLCNGRADALQLMRSACDLEKIDKDLKAIVAATQPAKHFDTLRSLATRRHECSAGWPGSEYRPGSSGQHPM